jgi:transcriptional regulator GlxA family with amidase domain
MGSPAGRQRLDVEDPRVTHVIDLIEQSPSADLIVSRLAREVNLSASRLQRLFVLHTGLTLARYIKGERLRRADHLVCGTFLTIKEIVAAVGLHDESHFVRDFKSSYGFTPTERRRAVRANK